MAVSQDQKIALCIGVAAGLHGLLLLLPIHQPKQKSQSPLTVRLVSSAPALEREPAIKEQPVSSEILPPTPETKITAAPPKQPLPDKPRTPLNRAVIISSVKETLSAPTPKYRSFSLSDHIETPEPAPVRADVLPLLLSSAPKLTSTRSSAGQATDLIQTADGEAMCWQQRGIPGETQRWYRVPVALCGHLGK